MSINQNHLVLVDDDEHILTSLELAFNQESFIVTTFTSGVKALAHIKTKPPDLVILDIKMPIMDGIEVLQHLRRDFPELPVIMLTSKADEIDQLLGLKMGADDYITKPFSQKLVIERARALLRRTHSRHQTLTNLIRKGDLLLDPERHYCSWKGHDIQLTVTEFFILQALALRPGVVKNRNQLMDAAYGHDIYVDDRTIDTHIKRLRQKFRHVDSEFTHIETLYGIGYRYRDV